jgi:hypothetical protein
VHEPVRFGAAQGLAVRAAVVEPQQLVCPRGSGHRHQHLGVHRRRARGDRHGHRPEPLDAVPQPRRQHGLQFGQRPQRRLLDPGDTAACRGPHPDRDGDRLLVVEQQRREHGARSEPVSGHPARGVDRIAECAQLVHVTPDGAHVDLEPFGQLGSRPLPRGLQQRQEAEQARGGLEHAPQSPSFLGPELS